MELSSLLCELPLLLEFLIELTTRSVLQDEVDSSGVIEVAVHTQDVGVSAVQGKIGLRGTVSPSSHLNLNMK